MFKVSIFAIIIPLISLKISAQNSTNQKLGFVSDNDLYVSLTLDRYYTNGLDFFYQTANARDSISNSKKIQTFKIGQKIYNPYYSYLYRLNKIDRPYAGYSYVQYAQNFTKPNYYIELGIEAGILGPDSKAAEAQEFIHQFYNIPPSKGWNNQVDKKLGGGIIVSNGFVLIKNTSLETSVLNNLTLTNINTNLSTALNTRVNLSKFELKDFNQTLFNKTNISKEQNNYKEFYLNYKGNLTYQTHDATVTHHLEDPMNQKEFKIVPWIFTHDIGIYGSNQHWDFSYHIIYYTKNVQSIKDLWNKYGTIELAYRF